MDLYLYNQLNFLLERILFPPRSKSPAIGFDPSNFKYVFAASLLFNTSDAKITEKVVYLRIVHLIKVNQ